MGDNTDNLLLVGPKGSFLRCLFILSVYVCMSKPACFFLTYIFYLDFLKLLVNTGIHTRTPTS